MKHNISVIGVLTMLALTGCASTKPAAAPAVDTMPVVHHLDALSNNLSNVDGKDAVIAEWYASHPYAR